MNIARVLLRRLPRRLKQWLSDRMEDLRRRRPPRHAGLAHLGLPPEQVYPMGVNFDEALRAGIARGLSGIVLRKDTPVASMGSCFADEFASHMRRTGFNYIRAESDAFPASANWGRVYTIPGLLQIVSYSRDDRFPLAIERSKDSFFDPLRDASIGDFQTREEAETAIRDHRSASRRAFVSARVLIVTLGQNEGWLDHASGLIWARRPPSRMLESEGNRFEARVFSFEENVRWMEEALIGLRQINPDLDVVLTVSPVATFATFCASEVITQSFAGKCILRAVADRLAGRVPGVWYFPSFEMALAYNPYAFAADNRHVKRSTVNRIFKLFHDTVVR